MSETSEKLSEILKNIHDLTGYLKQLNDNTVEDTDIVLKYFKAIPEVLKDVEKELKFVCIDYALIKKNNTTPKKKNV